MASPRWGGWEGWGRPNKDNIRESAVLISSYFKHLLEYHFCLGVQKSLSKWSLSLLLCLSRPILFQYILLALDDRNIPKLLHISKICCILNKSHKENVDRLCIRPIKFKSKKKIMGLGQRSYFQENSWTPCKGFLTQNILFF